MTPDEELLKRVLDNAAARRKESHRGGRPPQPKRPEQEELWEIRRRIYLIESGKVEGGEYELISLAQREHNLLASSSR
ncbi:MAG TPA: hypothetical protein VNH19_20795 [Candidatus Limnocylindrales bacterium]|nr:hypothetical protein [Candidatus Limnocylindrales bacterium]